MKTCRRCGKIKPTTDFHANKSAKDGLNVYCKPCAIARAAAHHIANRDKRLAEMRAYAEANRERVRAKQRQWELANPEKVTASRARANVDLARARRRRWSEKNKEAEATKQRNYKARKRAAAGSHTQAEVAALYKRQKGRCAICRVKLNGRYHADHIVPLIAGGTNYIANIQITCVSCNTTKSGRDPTEFMRDRGFLL